MLDAFAAVLVENDKTASLEDELVNEFKKLGSVEEIQKVASELVEVKSAYSDGDYSWLKQYEGSPLYQQAVDLEEQGLNIEAARIKSRMEKKEDNWYAQEDMIRLKKKLLDLELSKSKLTGGAGGKAAPDEQKEIEEPKSAPPPPNKPTEEPAMEHTASAQPQQHAPEGELKVSSIQAVDLAGRSLAHALYKRAGFFSNKPLVMPGAEERDAAVDEAGEKIPLQPLVGALGGSVAGASLGALAGHYGGGALGKRLGVDLSDPGRHLGAGLGALGGAGLGYNVGEHMAGGQEAVQGPLDRATLAMNAVDEGKIPGGPPESGDPRVNKGLSDQLAHSEIVGRAFGVGAGGLGGALLGGTLGYRRAGGVGAATGGALGGLAGLGVGGAVGGSMGRTLGALGTGGTMERNYNQAYAEDAAKREAARAAGATLEGSSKAASVAKYAAAVRVGSGPFVGSLEKKAFFGALASKAMPMLGNAATQVGSSVVGDKAAKTLGGVEKFINPVKALPAVAGTALQGLGKVTPVIGGAVGKLGKLITPS